MPQGLLYAEGLGLYAAGLGVSGLMWTAHAWTVTAGGTVIDPTWNHEEGVAYFGVILPLRWVAEVVRTAKVWGIREALKSGAITADDLRTVLGGAAVASPNPVSNASTTITASTAPTIHTRSVPPLVATRGPNAR